MSITFSQLEKEIRDLLDKKSLSIAEWEVLSKKVRRRVVNKVVDTTDRKPSQYASREFGIFCYEWMLETGDNAQITLQNVSEMFGKSSDWLKSVKNNKYYYVKEVVDSFNEHPTQKQLLKMKIMDKGYLKSSKSINQLLRRLHRVMCIYSQITDLQDQVSSAKTSAETLPIKNNKEIACQLRKQGVRLQQIANQLGVSLSTVKRLLKEEVL